MGVQEQMGSGHKFLVLAKASSEWCKTKLWSDHLDESWISLKGQKYKKYHIDDNNHEVLSKSCVQYSSWEHFELFSFNQICYPSHHHTIVFVSCKRGDGFIKKRRSIESERKKNIL